MEIEMHSLKDRVFINIMSREQQKKKKKYTKPNAQSGHRSSSLVKM